jgi:hypothetical protein
MNDPHHRKGTVMQLSQDPHFAAATVVVAAAIPPRRGGDLLDVGALVLRYSGFGYLPVGGGVRCVPDPSVDLATTIARSGLAPEQVHDRPPGSIALAYLDAHLTRPPYLVATHGPVLGQMIAAHRDSCPVLAELTILDTARLARHAFPGADPRLERWAGRLDISVLTDRVGERTRLTAALFMQAMGEVLRRDDVADLASLLRIAALEPPQRSSAPLALPGPTTPLQDRRLAWTSA